jgi:hypothetical protein
MLCWPAKETSPAIVGKSPSSVGWAKRSVAAAELLQVIGYAYNSGTNPDFLTVAVRKQLIAKHAVADSDQ